VTVSRSKLAPKCQLIAVVHCSGNKVARVTVEAWQDVIRSSARALVPFVALERRLRGDWRYKRHYLRLLKDLKISEDYDGLAVYDENHKNIA